MRCSASRSPIAQKDRTATPFSPSRACPPLARLAGSRVDAPVAGAMGGDEEKDEAVDDRKLTLVHDRPKAVWGVLQEVGDGHLTAGDERGHRAEKPDGHEQAANELDDAADPGERSQRRPSVAARGKSEELLPSVAGEQKADDETEENEDMWMKATQHRIHDAPPSPRYS